MISRRTVFAARLLAAGSCLALLGCLDRSRPPSTDAARAQSADIVDVLTLNGVLEARDQIVVKGEVAGRIKKIFVKAGDPIVKGQPILSIEPEQLNIRRKRNELVARRSLIHLRQSERDLVNAKDVESLGGISKQKLMDLRWQVDLADLQLRENRLELDATKLLLAKSTVIAPATGTLVSLSAKDGEVIMDGVASLGGGTPLGIIADLDNMIVNAKVSELDRQFIRPGQPAIIISEALPGRSFHAHVEYISRIASPQEGRNVRNFDVKVALDSASGQSLFSGVNVTVRFMLIELRNVLTIPYDLVYRDSLAANPESYVWINDGGVIRKQVVKTGATNYRLIQILLGLEEGQSVLMPPSGSQGRAAGPRT